MREQHLGAAQAVLAQLGLVDLGQAHLADGGRGLQLVDLVRAYLPTQALHAFGDGAAGHHHDLTALAHQGGELAAPLADGLVVQAPALVGDEAGSHLDHEAAGIAQDGGGSHGGHVRGSHVN